MTNPYSAWRQRLRDERQAEREHQQALLRAFLASLELIQANAMSESATNAGALVEIAKAMTAQAQGFGDWIKLFQVGAAPTSTTVRDEDEYRAEQIRAVEAGLPADIAALPEEFRLAWVLHNSTLDDSAMNQ